MNASDPGYDCEHGPDAAAYVLGALDEPATQVFAEHLTTCASCQREVAELQPVADALALGAPRADVPDGLRARIMAPVQADAELLGTTGRDTDRPAPARTLPLGGLRGALATAVALGVGLLIGALVLGSGSSPKVELIHASVVAPGHRATAVLRKYGTHLQLLIVGMPAPPRGRIYEVWLERGALAPEPTDALFSVTRNGDGSVGVPDEVRGLTQVLVTAEPFGGSLKPTRKPVISAKV